MSKTTQRMNSTLCLGRELLSEQMGKVVSPNNGTYYL